MTKKCLSQIHAKQCLKIGKKVEFSPSFLGTFKFCIMNFNIGEDKTFLAVFAHMPRTTIFEHFAAANRFS